MKLIVQLGGFFRSENSVKIPAQEIDSVDYLENTY